MLSRAEKGRLQERIALDARTLRLSNATVAWFLDRATPGQMQAVSELLSHELEVRRDSKHARLLRQARFPAVKSVSEFDPSDLRFQEGYGWEQLLGLEWLGQKQDFVFHGPTGRGKTHLAIALGMLAVDAGKSARFLSCAQLVFDLKAAKERGRLDERYQELSKVDLLILDEFGYIPLDSDGGEAAVPGDVELLRAPVDGADDQHRVREVGHGVGGRQAGIGAGGQDRPPWQAGGVQGREPPRHGLAHAGKQEGRVGPAALGEIRRSFVLRPERIG